MAVAKCEECGNEYNVIPARIGKTRFCSQACVSNWRKKHLAGENSPLFKGGIREKVCQHCGKTFQKPRRKAISVFEKQKFCSKQCADIGGFRYEGESHPNWKEVSRRKDRRGKHGAWSRAVISRDKATCQHCGATDVQLHAHHIKEFAKHPELRWDVSNGITLCFRCHEKVHTASTANGVNSGEVRTANGEAEDNPEPSFGRKPVEGVTTSGRVYRRWNGSCEWCGAFISKRWSDVKGKKHIFCSKQCSGSYGAKTNPNKFKRK